MHQDADALMGTAGNLQSRAASTVKNIRSWWTGNTVSTHVILRPGRNTAGHGNGSVPVMSGNIPCVRGAWQKDGSLLLRKCTTSCRSQEAGRMTGETLCRSVSHAIIRSTMSWGTGRAGHPPGGAKIFKICFNGHRRPASCVKMRIQTGY